MAQIPSDNIIRKQTEVIATWSAIDLWPQWFSYMCEEMAWNSLATGETGQQDMNLAVQSFRNRSKDRLRNSFLKQKCMRKVVKPDLIVERAIWMFYHDQLKEARPTDPDGANDTDLQFFRHILDKWQSSSVRSQRAYKTSAWRLMSILPIPMMPDDFAVPTHDGDAFATIKISPSDTIIATAPGSAPALQLQMHSLEILEKILAVDVEAFELISGRLASAYDTEETHWTPRINQTLQERDLPENIFGITGSTGVGKSTTINALLGIHLLPTSGGRACTAIPHVVEYNESLADTQVEISISYVDKDSWRHEVGLLHAYLQAQSQTDSTDTRDKQDEVKQDEVKQDEEEMMRIWDKFCVVYPGLTKVEAAATSLIDLVNHESIYRLLGHTERKSAQTIDQARAIVEQLNGIQVSGVTQEHEHAPEKSTPWPLVRNIVLQINNPLLSHGIKIVDLPGVNDSNRARAAVAREYTSKCTSMVVMAPIGRATNDSGARDLLLWCSQQGFHFDSSSLTFVCNQADTIDEPDISGPEFKVHKSIKGLRQKQTAIRNQINLASQEVQQLQTEETAASQAVDTIRKKLEDTEVTLAELEDRVLIIPANTGEKRKSRADEDSMTGNSALTLAARDCPAEEHNHKLSEMRAEFRKLSRDRRRSSQILEQQSYQLTKKKALIQPLEQKVSMIECQIWQACIAGRGEMAKVKVRKDCADFLRDMIAEQEHKGSDENAASNKHDISAKSGTIASKLPVLIISARAYRELFVSQQSQVKRILPPKEAVTALSSYQDVEETGIPALRQHFIEQTKSKRKVHVVRVLSKTSALLDSFDLWASGNELDEKVGKQDLMTERSWLMEKLSNIRQIIKGKIEDLQSNFGSVIQNEIVTKLLESRNDAKVQMPLIVSRFKDEVGSCMTFRAILVRDGVFTPKARGGCRGISYDFNKRLLQPITQIIDPSWSSIFGIVLDQEFSTNKDMAIAPMRNFHNSVCSRAKALGCSDKSLKVLNLQHERALSRIEDISSQRHQKMQLEQRKARRILYDKLQEALRPIYSEAAAIRGDGSFARMANTMNVGVGKIRSSVFSHGVNETTLFLNTAWDKAASGLLREVLDVVVNYAEDCEHIFQQPEDLVIGDECDLRSDVLEILNARKEKLGLKV